MAARMSGLRRLNMFIPHFRPLIVRQKDRAESATGHRRDWMKHRIIGLGGWLGHEEPFPFRRRGPTPHDRSRVLRSMAVEPPRPPRRRSARDRRGDLGSPPRPPMAAEDGT